MKYSMTPGVTAADFPETFAGRKLRELDEGAVVLFEHALSSPLITEAQRGRAWETFHATEDWLARMGWYHKVTAYVLAVRQGKRAVKTDMVAAPVATAEQVGAADAEAEAEQTYVPQAEPTASAAPVPVPMWVGAPQVEDLPHNLSWSGKQLPEVGETLLAVRQGRARRVKVAGYFHAEGFMGVLTEFEGRVPAQLSNCARSRCFFGSELHAAA